MLAVDTETTGLYLLNGCTTFAIGAYDGRKFTRSVVPVSPRSRTRTLEHSEEIKNLIANADMLVFHNARFDIKALCEANMLSWEEPASASFWRRIVDTSHLSHLYDNTVRLGLDNLTSVYLGKKYETEDELTTAVNLCRSFVRTNMPEWDIARADGKHHTFRMSGSGTEWNRMDYWLPAAVHRFIPEKIRPNLPDDRISRVLIDYLKADVINTYELAEHFFHQLLTRYGDDVERLLQINRDLEHVLWKMECKGIWLRHAEVEHAMESCKHHIATLRKTCYELSGLDRLTDMTLRELLFDKWKFDPLIQTRTGQNSVNAETLLRLHHEAEPGSDEFAFLGSYLSLKKYERKLQYLKNYKENANPEGYLNPSFHETGTGTTRFSTTNPNIQQVTKAGNPYEEDAPFIARCLSQSPPLRSCFGPSPGHWWLDCDYSQLQLRIFAYLTKEQEMIDAFNKGWDAHDFVARKIFQIPDNQSPTKAQRRVAKNVNFGFIFGAGPGKIERTAGIPGLWTTVTDLFPHAHQFIEETKRQISRYGYVETIGGYRLHLKDYFNVRTGVWEKAAHAGVNYIVQGAEGIIVKRAMKLCDDYFSSEYPEGRMVLQCHDELIFEMPTRFPKKHVWNLVDLMEQAASEYGIHAPVDPELCTQSWNKSVKVKR